MRPQVLQAGNGQASPRDPDQTRLTQFMKKAGEMLLRQIQPRGKNTFANGEIDGVRTLVLLHTLQLIYQVANDALLAGKQGIAFDILKQMVRLECQAAEQTAHDIGVTPYGTEDCGLRNVK